MKRERLLPAAFPDAIGPGEYHGDHVGCPRCGVVQPVANPRLRFACESPSCPTMMWIELAGAN